MRSVHVHVQLPHHRCELAPISVRLFVSFLSFCFLFMYFADYLLGCTFSVKSSGSPGMILLCPSTHTFGRVSQTNYLHLLLYSVSGLFHLTNDLRIYGHPTLLSHSCATSIRLTMKLNYQFSSIYGRRRYMIDENKHLFRAYITNCDLNSEQKTHFQAENVDVDVCIEASRTRNEWRARIKCACTAG